MKHSLRTTLLLVAIFLMAQLAGLAVTAKYLDTAALAKGEIAWTALPVGFERPQVEESFSYWYILIAVLIGTAIALILIRLRAVRTWKAWFFFAICLCLTIAFSAYLPQLIAFSLAVILALWRIFKPNVIVHNVTEVLLYGGLAAMFVPILNVFSVSMLLLLIAIYDAIAVWQSKHMIKLAQFQTDAKMFAGVFLPSGKGQVSAPKAEGESSGSVAVLGGGDIAFPLLFTGAVLKWLLASHPLAPAMMLSLIVTFFAAVALTLLLLFAKPKKFYPAMPFISAGCFVGYAVLRLVTSISKRK